MEYRDRQTLADAMDRCIKQLRFPTEDKEQITALGVPVTPVSFSFSGDSTLVLLMISYLASASLLLRRLPCSRAWPVQVSGSSLDEHGSVEVSCSILFFA